MYLMAQFENRSDPLAYVKWSQTLYSDIQSYNFTALKYVLIKIAACFQQKLENCLREIFYIQLQNFSWNSSRICGFLGKNIGLSESLWNFWLSYSTTKTRQGVARLPSPSSSKASDKCNCCPPQKNRPIRKDYFLFCWPQVTASFLRL